MGILCDGGGADCPNVTTRVCACARCDRETDDTEKFHTCEDHAHAAGQKHERVREKPPVWMWLPYAEVSLS